MPVLRRRRPGALVAGLSVLAIAVSVAARALLGPRGALVPELLILLLGVTISAFLAVHFARAALSIGLGRATGVFVGVLALAPGAFAAFVALQSILVVADLVLPVQVVRADVVRWHYVSAGRGPGSLHLTIADGSELAMPAFSLYSGPQTPGPYRLEVTSIERLVIDAWDDSASPVQ